jgi:hypothetical protein
MKEYSETVILNCGDALFIPEGWYIFLNYLYLSLSCLNISMLHKQIGAMKDTKPSLISVMKPFII